MVVADHHQHPIPWPSRIVVRPAFQGVGIELNPLTAAADRHPIEAGDIRARPSCLRAEGSDQQSEQNLPSPVHSGSKACLRSVPIVRASGVAVCRVILTGAQITGSGPSVVLNGDPGVEGSSQLNDHQGEQEKDREGYHEL